MSRAPRYLQTHVLKGPWATLLPRYRRSPFVRLDWNRRVKLRTIEENDVGAGEVAVRVGAMMRTTCHLSG